MIAAWAIYLAIFSIALGSPGLGIIAMILMTLSIIGDIGKEDEE
jgi:hypothetical protein